MEVGVMSGGTSIMSIEFLSQIQVSKRYLGIDTFGGFVSEQFRPDAAQGTSWSKYDLFSANSKRLVERILQFHGCEKSIELVKADICSITADQLPTEISACLVDVDLANPTYSALDKVWPRLSAGGMIVIDDCVESSGGWKALKGYQDFCSKNFIREEYMFGAGILCKPAGKVRRAGL
jgi:O-methyltransferase